MATNQFENSRISEGTLRRGAQHDGNALNESSAVSRDDVRDGFADPQISNMIAEGSPASQESSLQPAEGAGTKRLFSASTLLGERVRNLAGEEPGNIEELMVELTSGRIAYAVLSFGGFAGFGAKLFPVPWNALRTDRGPHEIVLDMDFGNLASAPHFDLETWPDMANQAFEKEVHGHYANLQLKGRKGNHMAKVTTMEELFLDEIRDLYDAEKQLTKALPEMAKAAASDELRNAFEEHLAQTKNQVQRLERIFDGVGAKATGKKCAAMAGLIKEGDEMASNTEETAVRDAGLIAAAQKVEHYEISGYGSARAHADLLGNAEAVRLLQETLDEEREADEKLNELAQSTINEEAASTSGNGGGAVRTTRPKTKTAGGGSSHHAH